MCDGKVHVKVTSSLHTSQEALSAGAYPSFCSMKWLGVFLLPLDGKRGGLMVRGLDSGVSGPGSSPARDIVWVLVNLMLGVTLQWTSILPRREKKYSQSLRAVETGIRSGLMGHNWLVCRLAISIPVQGCSFYCQLQWATIKSYLWPILTL